MSDSNELTTILEQRGGQYGDFGAMAELTQKLEDLAFDHAKAHGVALTATHKEGLHMIFHKIARICNGNPNKQDSWTDIAGYAKCVEVRLPPEFGQVAIKIGVPFVDTPVGIPADGRAAN